jgi:hypothetical protein
MLIKFLCLNFLFLPAYNNALAALATDFPGTLIFWKKKRKNAPICTPVSFSSLLYYQK